MRKTRADSRARTPCPRCAFRVHGERGLRAHLRDVHELDAETAEAEAKSHVVALLGSVLRKSGDGK